MLSTPIFFILFAIGLSQATPITNESCDAQIVSSSSQCSSSINILSPSCKSASLNLSKTGYKWCSSVNLMWSNPKNNLTLIIETSFSQLRQSYAISMNNRLIQDYSLKFYRILNDQEIEIKSNEDNILLSADANYQIIIKLQGPAKFYSFPIIYNVVKL